MENNSKRKPTLRLLFGYSGLGDAVLLTPTLRQWKRRYPDGKLVLLCSLEKMRDIFVNNPHVDSLRMFSWWHRIVFMWPQLRDRLAKFYVLLGYDRSLGIAGQQTPAFRMYAQKLGVYLDDPNPEMFLTKKELNAAESRLSGIRNPITLHTTSAHSRNNHWSPANWEALIRMCPHYTFVQLGGGSEPLVPGAVDLRGLSLRQSFAIIASSRAHVGINSGFYHVAVALRIPTIALFGATSPQVWGHSNATILYADLPCSPCADSLTAGWCPYDVACMRAITPAHVAGALEANLNLSN
jgi:ADP-heptose:LPS heptosyltransferase